MDIAVSPNPDAWAIAHAAARAIGHFDAHKPGLFALGVDDALRRTASSGPLTYSKVMNFAKPSTASTPPIRGRRLDIRG